MTEQPRERTEPRTQEGLNFRMLQLLTKKIDIQQSTYLRGKNLKTSKRRKFFEKTQTLLTGPIELHEGNLRKDIATYRKTKQLIESTS